MTIMTHFKIYKDREVLGMVLSVLTLGLVFIFWYEYFYHRTYYENRKQLLKLLKECRVQIKSSTVLYLSRTIIEKKILIGDEEYCVWISDTKNEFTLSSIGHKSSFIGLYIGDKIANIRNQKILKLIRNL